jgi:hypothetical protein
VQGEVPAAELDHGRAGNHRRLSQGKQDQANGNHPAAPAPDPLRVLQGDQDRGQPLADQAVLRRESRFGYRGA